MNTFLTYILESTICISVFYLLFRVLMRKETSFAVNRATLLTIVAASVIVPLVQLPQLLQTPVHVELIPEFSESKVQIQNLPATENAASFEVQQPVGEPTSTANELTIPLETLLRYFYLAGVLVALLLFIRNVVLIFLLSRKATVRQMDGYRLLIVDREVPSFTFGRSVIISQTDYDAHGQAILAHEQAHIRQNHFVDLLLLELVRTIHWFNPAVYALIGDMKEIHEFQADEQTLHSGIDAKQYQLLIIQKGVGPRRFALANSFNHCQIKKRITMMNKSKTSKAWRWKVATFLPLLALLLMAFGNRSEKVPVKDNVPEKVIETPKAVPSPQISQSSLLIEIRKDGNYIDNKLCTVEELKRQVEVWNKSGVNSYQLKVKSEKEVSLARVSEVLRILRNTGVKNIDQSELNPDQILYYIAEVMPEFPGGEKALRQWINDHVQYPVEAKAKGVEGKVFVNFIIDPKGKVINPKIARSANPAMDAEALRIISQLPDWTPGKQKGVPVNVSYTQPVYFSLK